MSLVSPCASLDGHHAAQRSAECDVRITASSLDCRVSADWATGSRSKLTSFRDVAIYVASETLFTERNRTENDWRADSWWRLQHAALAGHFANTRRHERLIALGAGTKENESLSRGLSIACEAGALSRTVALPDKSTEWNQNMSSSSNRSLRLLLLLLFK